MMRIVGWSNDVVPMKRDDGWKNVFPIGLRLDIFEKMEEIGRLKKGMRGLKVDAVAIESRTFKLQSISADVS